MYHPNELDQQIKNLRTLQESYDQLAQQNAQLAADVQAIKDAHILEFNTGGVVWTHPEDITPLKLLIYKDAITHLVDDSIEVMINAPSAGIPGLEYLEFKKLTEVRENKGSCFFYMNTWGAREAHFPSLTYLSSSWFNANSTIQELYFDVAPYIDSYNFLWDCPALRKLYIPKANGFYHLDFNNCPDLIDIITGSDFSNNISLYYWSPTNALLSTSQSLLTPKDIETGFTSNLEKLLYNIREHIAANLPTITDGYSITFSAEIKAAILADQPTADAFTNKGWTIA